MEKVLINQVPSCTVEPNAGLIEMPDMRRYVVAKVQGVPSKNALDARWMSEFCPGVNALDCTYHRSPADAA
jgi:ribosome-binding ATPase YchF (GTP1/OBG family)